MGVDRPGRVDHAGKIIFALKRVSRAVWFGCCRKTGRGGIKFGVRVCKEEFCFEEGCW
jgi:hypothetical protein